MIIDGDELEFFFFKKIVLTGLQFFLSKNNSKFTTYVLLHHPLKCFCLPPFKFHSEKNSSNLHSTFMVNMYFINKISHVSNLNKLQNHSTFLIKPKHTAKITIFSPKNSKKRMQNIYFYYIFTANVFLGIK